MAYMKTAPLQQAGKNAKSLPDRVVPAATPPDLTDLFQASPVPGFAIDMNHLVTHWNAACERLTGVAAANMRGTSDHWRPFHLRQQPMLVDFIADGMTEAARRTGQHETGRGPIMQNTCEEENFFPQLGESGLWLFFSCAPLHDRHGQIAGAIATVQDVTLRKQQESKLHAIRQQLEQQAEQCTLQLAQAHARIEGNTRQRETAETELLRRNAELIQLNAELTAAQEQLVQSDKLASIGLLADGVAHEINNPIGYIFSNFGTLENYIASLMEMLAAYEEAESAITSQNILARLDAVRRRIELDYLKIDIPVLMGESKEGIGRVRSIVQDLKDFSRSDANQEWQWANIHQGIDSTLNIVSNEVKYKADVIKQYGVIPDIECLPSQINQVIMNIVVNAAHAISGQRGRITIGTGSMDDQVWIEISDTGIGMSKEVMSRIFDPFFTTKPIGQGTGLGLSVSYGIIQKHHGKIEVESKPGNGTCFRISLPVRHADQKAGVREQP